MHENNLRIETICLNLFRNSEFAGFFYLCNFYFCEFEFRFPADPGFFPLSSGAFSVGARAFFSKLWHKSPA